MSLLDNRKRLVSGPARQRIRGLPLELGFSGAGFLVPAIPIFAAVSLSSRSSSAASYGFYRRPPAELQGAPQGRLAGSPAAVTCRWSSRFP